MLDCNICERSNLHENQMYDSCPVFKCVRGSGKGLDIVSPVSICIECEKAPSVKACRICKVEKVYSENEELYTQLCPTCHSNYILPRSTPQYVAHNPINVNLLLLAIDLTERVQSLEIMNDSGDDKDSAEPTTNVPIKQQVTNNEKEIERLKIGNKLLLDKLVQICKRIEDYEEWVELPGTKTNKEYNDQLNTLLKPK